MHTDYDIIIAGGGMVGGLLAAALSQPELMQPGLEPLSICVLEAAPPKPFPRSSEPRPEFEALKPSISNAPNYDLRVSAISVASRNMLQRVGAWQGVLDRRACRYDELLVWDGEANGRTHFRSANIGRDALGYIVENRVVQLALLDVLESQSNVAVMSPARCERFRTDHRGVSVTLDTGERITSRLLIGADGANSGVRKQAGIDTNSSQYDQQALVATVETKLPQQSITWQRFVPSGPQAMLPLCGSRASVVWYHSAEEVARLAALDNADFCACLNETFPPQLGGVTQVHARGHFPLVRAHAARYVGHRIALIGDAAHSVHPLAGQGVNLGLLDAGALAEVVVASCHAGRDIGDQRQLERYERWRRSENALMINALDGIHHAFRPQPALVRSVRSLGLSVVDKVGPIKDVMMRQAMGIGGDLPQLAIGRV